MTGTEKGENGMVEAMRSRKLISLVGIAVVALVSVLLARSGAANGSGTHRVAGESLPQSVILDPPYNSEQFDPPGPNDMPALTAEEAIAAFQKADAEFNPPNDMQVWLGLYTATIGNGDYRYSKQLAYGLTYHECARMQNPNYDAEATPPPCTFWLFLDANTGQMLEGVYQQGK